MGDRVGPLCHRPIARRIDRHSGNSTANSEGLVGSLIRMPRVSSTPACFRCYPRGQRAATHGTPPTARRITPIYRLLFAVVSTLLIVATVEFLSPAAAALYCLQGRHASGTNASCGVNPQNAFGRAAAGQIVTELRSGSASGLRRPDAGSRSYSSRYRRAST